MLQPSSHRVARRFRAVVLGEPEQPVVQLILSDGGIITIADIRRFLEPKLGVLAAVQLGPALSQEPATFTWEALDEAAQVVTGRVVLHACVKAHEIVVWADLFVDQTSKSKTGSAGTPAQLLDDRLRRVARLARRLIETVRVRPDVPALAIVDDLVRIVEVADGE